MTRATSALNRLAAILRRGTTLTLEAPMPLLAHTDHAPCASCSTTDRTKFDYPADGLCSECLYRLLDNLHTDHYPTLEDTVPLKPYNGDAAEDTGHCRLCDRIAQLDGNDICCDCYPQPYDHLTAAETDPARDAERTYDLEVGERADQAPDAVAARMGICNADLWERRITRDPSTLCSHGNEVRGEWATDCIACENERDARTCSHGYVGDGDCLACEAQFAAAEARWDNAISLDDLYGHSDPDLLGPVQGVYLAREPIEHHCGDAATTTKEAHVPLSDPHSFNYGRLTPIQRAVLATTHRMTLAACPPDLATTLEDECAQHAWELYGPAEGTSMELSVQIALGGVIVPDDIVGPPASVTGSYSPVVTSCVIPTQYGDLFFHFCL